MGLGGVGSAALVDRLLHHCHIVNIQGNSYRMSGHRALPPSWRLPRSAPSPEPADRARKRPKVALLGLAAPPVYNLSRRKCVDQIGVDMTRKTTPT